MTLPLPTDAPASLGAAFTPHVEALRTEEAFAIEAVAASDEQVRSLPALLASAHGAKATINAADASKLVAATIAVNAQLKAQLAEIQKAIRMALVAAEKQR